MTMHPDEIHVRLFAAARAAANGQGDVVMAVTSLAEVVEILTESYGPEMASVLARSSFLVNDVAVSRGNQDRPLEPGANVDVLPPFAGG